MNNNRVYVEADAIGGLIDEMSLSLVIETKGAAMIGDSKRLAREAGVCGKQT